MKYSSRLDPPIYIIKAPKEKRKRLKTYHTYPVGLINWKEAEGNWKAKLSVFLNDYAQIVCACVRLWATDNLYSLHLRWKGGNRAPEGFPTGFPAWETIVYCSRSFILIPYFAQQNKGNENVFFISCDCAILKRFSMPPPTADEWCLGNPGLLKD